MDNDKAKKIAMIALMLSLLTFGVSVQYGFLNDMNMINIYQIYNLTAWNATFVNNSNLSGTIIDFPIKNSYNLTGFIDAGSMGDGLAFGITDMPLEFNGTSGVKTNDTSNQSIYTMHPGSVNTFVSFDGNYTCGGQFNRGYGFGFGTNCTQFIQIEAGTDAITGTAGEADLGGGLNMGGNRIYNSPDISYIWTTGVISGGNITFYPGNGTIHIEEGLAMIRTGANQTDRLITVKFDAKDFTIVYGETKYIYLDFLSGVTELKETALITDIHGFAQIQVYQTFLNDQFHYIDARGMNIGTGKKVRDLLFDTQKFKHAYGTVIGNPSQLNLSVTSGRFYYILNVLDHVALNTVTGDKIEYYWHDAAGTWFSSQNTTVNNTFYNPSGSGLVNLLPGKYKTEFVYLTLSSDATTEINIIMGENSYTTITDAEAATIPASSPQELISIGVLIGRVIVREGSTTLISVNTAFTTQFTPSGIFDHNSAANLQGGMANEYYHLNASIYNAAITYLYNFQSSVEAAMSSITSSLQTNIDAKVNKSGDTMTGVLNFSQNGFEMMNTGVFITTYSQFNGTGNVASPFVEVDASNYINFTNERLEWTNVPRTSKNYVYQDVGVGTIPSDINMTWDWNNSRGTSFYAVNFVGVSQQLDDFYHLQTSTSNYLGADYSGSTNSIVIVEKHGAGAQTSSSGITVIDNTNYSINLTNSGTTSTLHVYTYHTTTDIAGSPVTLTTTSQTYRYAFIFNNYNDGASGIYSGWLDNMYLKAIGIESKIWCVRINQEGTLYSTLGHC